MAIFLNLERPLPNNAQEDIEAVLDNVQSFVTSLATTTSQRPEYPFGRVIRQVADSLSIDFQTASRLFRALDNLHEFKQELRDTREVVALLEKRLSSERAKKLKGCVDQFSKIIDLYSGDHPFFISSKAERLSYLHENLYQDGEIITDARPVFNEDGSKIIEMVVTHSLVVSAYKGGWHGERVHFAMDAADVLRLRDLCERAIQKAAALKEAMAGCQWEVRVLNESNNGT
jgi:hypothetical protein